MNPRRDYVETLLFGRPDRIPLEPGAGRESTRRKWHQQGLPAEIDNNRAILEYAYRQAGGVEPLPQPGEPFPVSERMIPEFEEKVIERTGRTQIVQDWKGNVCEISSDYTVEYLRHPLDFVTRRWIRCPVETWEDWENMKHRYDPRDPRRFPEDVRTLSDQLHNRDWVVAVEFAGPFWQMREWLGFENLCLKLYDDPHLIRDMVCFWSEFVARLLETTLQYIIPDVFCISEDMAYKQFSMISPAMVREYLSPVYVRWGEIVRQAGVPIFQVDSDGFIGQLIPLWIEAGINACEPVEAAAENDIVSFRTQFGRDMAYCGGVDKRAIAAGGNAIVHEIQRLRPVIDSGGFVPGCDHAVPSDVSWDNYVRYVELLARATGWL